MASCWVALFAIYCRIINKWPPLSVYIYTGEREGHDMNHHLLHCYAHLTLARCRIRVHKMQYDSVYYYKLSGEVRPGT